jgi:GNAT superfamily N-acetyltransferase
MARADTRAVSVRDARADDAWAVAALLGELGYPTSPRQAAWRLERLGREPGSRALVAIAGGEIAGVAALRVVVVVERDTPSCQLTGLVVSERHRRGGVGRALVEAVEAEARRSGCDRVVVGSARAPADAHTFYRNLGYEETGTRFTKILA